MTTTKNDKAAVNSPKEEKEKNSNGVFEMPSDYQLVTHPDGNWTRHNVSLVIRARIVLTICL